VFFLLYHGNGYTEDSIRRMPIDLFGWHVKKLVDQKSAEKKAQDDAMKRAKLKSR
jgi:hypothetical protein